MAGKSERTEKPTPKRRRDARRKGQVPRSRELAFGVSFLAVVLFLGFSGGGILDLLQEPFKGFLGSRLLTEVTEANVQDLFFAVGWSILKLAAPLVLLTAFFSLGTLLAQGGFVFASEAFKPKPEKLNPVKNAQRVFSKNGAVQLVKSVLLVSVITYLSVTVIWRHIDDFQRMAAMDVRAMLRLSGGILFEVGLWTALALLVLALIDFLFQRHSFEEKLKMTKQEVRDEHKDLEGDPRVKARIRRIQFDLARRRMMAAVKEADVVVTNPTHFAVALKFDMDTMAAPQVTAKGQDYLALRIRREAEEHRVPLVEDVDLARALYRTVEIGEEVPVQLYRAVAQILAHVYKLKKLTYR
jgi:flagellar biosynthesis protein FlhB